MKKLIYIFPISGLLLLACSANQKIESEIETSPTIEEISAVDDSTEVYQEYLGEKLNPIRKYVAEVDAVDFDDWSLVTDKSLELNSEQVVASIYVWNSTLKKIKVINQDPKSQGESNYYFKNNELVYVSEQSMKELGGDGILLFKNKSYFENETLIRSLNNQDCGSPYNEEYRVEEYKRIMADLDIIRAAFEQN